MTAGWIISLVALLALVGLAGERFGENRVRVECDKHDEAQQQVTIDAQTHVIGEIQTQNNITQGAENDYEKNRTAIADLYAVGLQSIPASARAGVRPVSGAACGTQTSKRYKLTPAQCDQEEAKCNVLWNWAQAQAVVK